MEEANMTSKINIIVNILTLGVVFWLRGLDDNNKAEKIAGASIIFISIIFNMLDYFKLI